MQISRTFYKTNDSFYADSLIDWIREVNCRERFLEIYLLFLRYLFLTSGSSNGRFSIVSQTIYPGSSAPCCDWIMLAMSTVYFSNCLLSMHSMIVLVKRLLSFVKVDEYMESVFRFRKSTIYTITVFRDFDWQKCRKTDKLKIHARRNAWLIIL